jgi:hypothetical protein
MDNGILIAPREIPYDELAHLGLDRQMVDDLPQPAMDSLLQSRPTPLLSLRIERPDGGVKDFHGRVMLLKFDDDNVHAVVIPRMKTIMGLEDFDMDEQEHLLGGNVLKIKEPTGSYYAQLDKVTNQVLKMESAGIDYNMSVISGNENNAKYFSTTSLTDLSEGRPVTLQNDEGPGMCTIGIDLLTPTGIRFSAGGIDAFEKDKRTDDMMRYSFGNFGCWTLTDDDSLEYTKEEDYSPEMRKIQSDYLSGRKAGEDNRKQQNIS